MRRDDLLHFNCVDSLVMGRATTATTENKKGGVMSAESDLTMKEEMHVYIQSWILQIGEQQRDTWCGNCYEAIWLDRCEDTVACREWYRSMIPRWVYLASEEKNKWVN